jgi:hypothetical protein
MEVGKGPNSGCSAKEKKGGGLEFSRCIKFLLVTKYYYSDYIKMGMMSGT